MINLITSHTQNYTHTNLLHVRPASWKENFKVFIIAMILRDKTIEDKLIYIPNDGISETRVFNIMPPNNLDNMVVYGPMSIRKEKFMYF